MVKINQNFNLIIEKLSSKFTEVSPKVIDSGQERIQTGIISPGLFHSDLLKLDKNCFEELLSASKNFDDIYFENKMGKTRPFLGNIVHTTYMDGQNEKAIVGRIISSSPDSIKIFDAGTGNIYAISTEQINKFSVKPSIIKWHSDEVKNLNEVANIIQKNPDGFCLASVKYINNATQEIETAVLTGKLSIVEYAPDYKVVQIKEGNGVTHLIDLDCTKTNISVADKYYPELNNIKNGTETKPVNLVFSPGEERMALFNEFFNDMYNKNLSIFDNPKFYDYLTKNLDETKHLIDRWYGENSEKLILEFNKLGLEQKNIVLLADPGIASRMDKLAEFVDLNKHNHSIIGTPSDLRKAFSNWLGTTKIYRGMVLSDNDMKQISQNGLFAHGLVNKDSGKRAIMKLIAPEQRYSLMTENNFLEEIQTRISGYSYGDGMIMSASKYEDVAKSVGYHSSGRCDKGVEPYLFSMEVPTISTLYPKGLFNAEYRVGGQLKIGDNIYDMENDPVELFVPFVMPKGFQCERFDIPPVNKAVIIE